MSVIRVYLLIVLPLALVGCASLGRPIIRAAGVSVAGVKDAGKPAVLATQEANEDLTIPEGSRVLVVQQEAQPATAEAPAKPATVTTEIMPSAAMLWSRSVNSIHADTGTVDTSIAKHRIDKEAAKPLLLAFIGSLLLAGVCVYFKYPTAAMLMAGAAAVFLIAWKVSDAPWWLWMLGPAAIVGGLFLMLGYRRGFKDANNNGIPDIFERPAPAKTQHAQTNAAL